MFNNLNLGSRENHSRGAMDQWINNISESMEGIQIKSNKLASDIDRQTQVNDEQ